MEATPCASSLAEEPALSAAMFGAAYGKKGMNYGFSPIKLLPVRNRESKRWQEM